MAYVKRNKEGKIIAVSVERESGFEELLSTESEEYLDFIQSGSIEPDSAKHALTQSDADIARVTEDLIYLLMEKQVILFTELPVAVQQKLLNREKLRKFVRTGEPSIIDDAGSI